MANSGVRREEAEACSLGASMRWGDGCVRFWRRGAQLVARTLALGVLGCLHTLENRLIGTSPGAREYPNDGAKNRDDDPMHAASRSLQAFHLVMAMSLLIYRVGRIAVIFGGRRPVGTRQEDGFGASGRLRLWSQRRRHG